VLEPPRFTRRTPSGKTHNAFLIRIDFGNHPEAIPRGGTVTLYTARGDARTVELGAHLGNDHRYAYDDRPR
jgi:hypothetical protein